MGKKGALLTTTEGFGENTTIHGLYYIFTSQKTSDRIFWGLLVLCFTGKCDSATQSEGHLKGCLSFVFTIKLILHYLLKLGVELCIALL